VVEAVKALVVAEKSRANCPAIFRHNKMKTLPKPLATRKGYIALTTAYKLPDERWMLENVIADMERLGTDAVLVEVEGGPEVWRKPIPQS
jgi:hypothetical protein